MRIIYVLCLLCSVVDANALDKSPHPVHFSNAGTYQKYSYKIIPAASNTYGYEIYSGGKLFIKQLTIPGIIGTKGFRKKTDAEKVANLVISKIAKGIMPPAIDKTEMDQLKIKY